jgi:hypothetical protein
MVLGVGEDSGDRRKGLGGEWESNNCTQVQHKCNSFDVCEFGSKQGKLHQLAQSSTPSSRLCSQLTS